MQAPACHLPLPLPLRGSGHHPCLVGWHLDGASESLVPVTYVVSGTRPSGGYSWGLRLLQGSHLQAGTPAGCPALTHSHCPAPPSFPAIPVANQSPA